MTNRILATAILATLTACGEGTVIEGEPAKVAHSGLTWEQFNALIHQEPGTDVYIVDGDTPIVGEKNLREFYDRNVANGAGALTVNRIGNADDRWNDTQKKNLTYCVNKAGFGSRYAAVVQAMAEATGAWMAVADVKFVHAAAQDGSCTSSNSAVVFDVNLTDAGGAYLARAFFPSQGRSTRNVLIDSGAFGPTGTPLVGVLRHELGHALGFRHEHTRPESGACFEDASWRSLTTYDSASVMHYPQCNGTGGWSLALTSKDAQGAAALYGAPGQQPAAPTPAPSGASQTLNGSVAKGAATFFGPFAVEPGTTFDVAMTGSGDPDLYVRFGAKPTTSAYDCRPYLDGAEESCSLTVPAGKTSAWLMVAGYTASTFSLALSYAAGATAGAVPPADPTPAGTVKSVETDGTVAAGQDAVFNAITVLEGTAFTVAMTGSGDPDLYVRFGAQPTSAAYHCRPYQNGPNETCNLTVPAGETKAFISVHGYSDASFHLAIGYTAP